MFLEKTEVRVFEVLLIKTNTNLDGKTIQIQLNGTTVESNVSGKSIGIFIPDISAGTYPLAITINGVKQQFDIKVNNISAISNPTLYLDDYFVKTLQSTDRYRTYIDSLVSEGIMDATLATTAASAATAEGVGDCVVVAV